MPDTAFHRIFQCTLALDAEGMCKRLKHWGTEHPVPARGILNILPPVLPPCDWTPTYRLFGKEVSKDHFVKFLPEDGPVYIDGSVLHGKTPFAAAGWAALQVNSGGTIIRSMHAALDRDFPAASDFAEHVACHYAAAHAAEDRPITIVTDCASVVTYFTAKKKGTSVTYDKVLGGIWVDIDVSRIVKVDKIKSHLSFPAADARGMGQWWKGNSLVDALAQEAARSFAVPEAEAREYEKRCRFASSYLRQLSVALLG
jgi:hypothetical protein